MNIVISFTFLDSHEPNSNVLNKMSVLVFCVQIVSVCFKRQKTMHAMKLKTKIMDECRAREQEDKCLKEYKSEIDLLLQEKMAHVEVLRLVHADISLVMSTHCTLFSPTQSW